MTDASLNLIASKWGICPKYVGQNPDLKAILTKANHSAFLHFGHQVRKEGEHWLLPFQGTWEPWPTLQMWINKGYDFVCGKEGLVEAGERVSELPMEMQGEAGFELEIIVAGTSAIADGLRGHLHTWVRLYDPNGSVMSAGYAGQGQQRGLRSFLKHLTPQPGVLHMPDRLEFHLERLTQHEGKVTAHRLGIDQVQHNLLLTFLKRWRKDPEDYHFLGFKGGNCVSMVNYLLKILGHRTSAKTPMALRRYLTEIAEDATARLRPL